MIVNKKYLKRVIPHTLKGFFLPYDKTISLYEVEFEENKLYIYFTDGSIMNRYFDPKDFEYIRKEHRDEQIDKILNKK